MGQGEELGRKFLRRLLGEAIMKNGESVRLVHRIEDVRKKGEEVCEVCEV